MRTLYKALRWIAPRMPIRIVSDMLLDWKYHLIYLVHGKQGDAWDI